MGYVYIIQPIECIIDSNIQIYKVGYSDATNFKRLLSYKNGSVIIAFHKTPNAFICEQAIISTLKVTANVSLHAGNEYFRGEYFTIMDVFMKIINDDYNHCKQHNIIINNQQHTTEHNTSVISNVSNNILNNEYTTLNERYTNIISKYIKTIEFGRNSQIINTFIDKNIILTTSNKCYVERNKLWSLFKSWYSSIYIEKLDISKDRIFYVMNIRFNSYIINSGWKNITILYEDTNEGNDDICDLTLQLPAHADLITFPSEEFINATINTPTKKDVSELKQFINKYEKSAKKQDFIKNHIINLCNCFITEVIEQTNICTNFITYNDVWQAFNKWHSALCGIKCNITNIVLFTIINDIFYTYITENGWNNLKLK
jgi:hypothetical protein